MRKDSRPLFPLSHFTLDTRQREFQPGFQSSFIPPAIERKQIAHNITCPEAPSNRNPNPSNFTGPSACRSAITMNAASRAAMGNPTTAANCSLTINCMVPVGKKVSNPERKITATTGTTKISTQPMILLGSGSIIVGSEYRLPDA